MSDETKKKIKDLSAKVLETIKSDNVTMHSRYYFMARSTLWTLGLILAFSVTLYIVSFIAFVFRGNGLLLLPALGGHGWFVLFMSLPWLLLVLVFGIFVVLQLLSMHFSFVYKRPLVHTILGSIFLLVVSGVLLAQTTIHERVYEMSVGRKLPFAGQFYAHALLDRDDSHVGLLTTFDKETASYVFERRDGGSFTVVVTEETRLPPFALEFNFPVLVLGEIENGVINALGIRPFAPNTVLLRREQPGEKRTPTPRPYRPTELDN